MYTGIGIVNKSDKELSVYILGTEPCRIVVASMTRIIIAGKQISTHRNN